MKHGQGWVALALVCLLGGLTAGRASAEDVVFLQDGRTIRVDKVEVQGDRVRVERAGTGEVLDLPKSEVLSVHGAAPPLTGPGSPAAVYPNFVEQMSDAVRSQRTTGLATRPTPLQPNPR